MVSCLGGIYFRKPLEGPGPQASPPVKARVGGGKGWGGPFISRSPFSGERDGRMGEKVSNTETLQEVISPNLLTRCLGGLMENSFLLAFAVTYIRRTLM